MTLLPDHVDTFLRAIVKPEQPIRVREVALLLGVHPNTVKRIDPEELPYFRVGSRGDRRYQRDDVRRYIWTSKVAPCDCGECRCPFPCKPGTTRDGRMICWRCKEGRHTT